PELLEKVSKKIRCKFLVVDSNSIIPLSFYGEFVSAARILRPRVHRLFPEAWKFRSSSKPEKPFREKGDSWLEKNPNSPLKRIVWFEGDVDQISEICKNFNFHFQKIPPVPGKKGGRE
ncbi:deoxyribodipyrimidine photolyase, partial [Leptospira interrogans serovar Pomona]|nr:deoxyribodipyrimidine photolyase [Leptospira interrogans serovar Pomona]